MHDSTLGLNLPADWCVCDPPFTFAIYFGGFESDLLLLTSNFVDIWNPLVTSQSSFCCCRPFTTPVLQHTVPPLCISEALRMTYFFSRDKKETSGHLAILLLLQQRFEHNLSAANSFPTTDSFNDHDLLLEGNLCQFWLGDGVCRLCLSAAVHVDDPPQSNWWSARFSSCKW